MFEVRGPEASAPLKGGNTVANLFLGSDAWMWTGGRGFQVFKGESNEEVMDEQNASEADTTVDHMQDFLDACRKQKPQAAHGRDRDRLPCRRSCATLQTSVPESDAV